MLNDDNIHELPGEKDVSSDPVINVVLTARIEALEAENNKLKKLLDSPKPKYLKLEAVRTILASLLMKYFLQYSSFLVQLLASYNTGEPALIVLVGEDGSWI